MRRMFLSPGATNEGGALLLVADYRKYLTTPHKARSTRREKPVYRHFISFETLTLKTKKEALKMSSLTTMSADELSNLLDEYGIKHGPVVGE